jgi:mannosyltransferase OCH1-like enzyme
MKTNWPSFNEAMRFNRNYNLYKADLDKWLFLQKKYEEILNRPQQEQKIPKILHQIWLGSHMPEREIEYCRKVKNSLPVDWEYKLWRDSDVNQLTNFTQQELFNATPNLGQKSDILRLHILCEYGGIYCDTDFILHKPFNDLLDLDFFAGIMYDNTPNLANGLMGSSPKNDLILDMQVFQTPIQHNDGMAIINTTGQGHITSKVFKHKNTFTNFVALPNTLVYPFPNCPSCRELGPDYNAYITKETYCCHLWHGSWM